MTLPRQGENAPNLNNQEPHAASIKIGSDKQNSELSEVNATDELNDNRVDSIKIGT